MSRIRTIKPDFFRHECLYEAERETGLPLRVAYAGLWTVADREGRFRWRPRELKLDVLPYDDLDFSRVLDALATRGFVVSYEVDGQRYGVVPSFTKHQVVNNRERPSALPAPNENSDLTREGTREPRVNDASATRPSPSHSPSSSDSQGESEGEATELPDNWKPDKEPIAFATQQGLTELDIRRATQRFTNWARENSVKRKDWLGAWHDWVMGDAQKLDRRPAAPTKPLFRVRRGTKEWDALLAHLTNKKFEVGIEAMERAGDVFEYVSADWNKIVLAAMDDTATRHAA
jgi:hypothetical protein